MIVPAPTWITLTRCYTVYNLNFRLRRPASTRTSRVNDVPFVKNRPLPVMTSHEQYYKAVRIK